VSTALLVAIALGAAPADPSPRLQLTPHVRQGLALHRSSSVLAGGVGGAVGAEVGWDERYLAAADVGLLWLLGNAGTVRLSVGVQRAGTWAPAAWLSGTVLFASRLELLDEQGDRPPLPNWGLSLRASPLRLVNRTGIATVLEPGIGTDFRGGLWLELTLVQAGVRW